MKNPSASTVFESTNLRSQEEHVPLGLLRPLKDLGTISKDKDIGGHERGVEYFRSEHGSLGDEVEKLHD